MIYNGFRTYSQILKLKNQNELSQVYQNKVLEYRRLIDSLWWNDEIKSYFALYKFDKQFNKGISGSEFASNSRSNDPFLNDL
jgi:hypothetical protein